MLWGSPLSLHLYGESRPHVRSGARSPRYTLCEWQVSLSFWRVAATACSLPPPADTTRRTSDQPTIETIQMAPAEKRHPQHATASGDSRACGGYIGGCGNLMACGGSMAPDDPMARGGHSAPLNPTACDGMASGDARVERRATPWPAVTPPGSDGPMPCGDPMACAGFTTVCGDAFVGVLLERRSGAAPWKCHRRKSRHVSRTRPTMSCHNLHVGWCNTSSGISH